MKTIKFILAMGVFAFMVLSCSSSSSSDDSNNTNVDPNPAYAMTWKMNGVQYNRNNAWGTNVSSPNLFEYYPDSEFIWLQGTSLIGMSDGIEIDINIKRTDLVVGTYPVNKDTDRVTTHIDLINNTNTEQESTREGSITITSINPVTKRVKGTFHFKTSDDNEGTPYTVNYNITDGTFDYRYDVE